MISRLESVRGVSFDWIPGTDSGLLLPEGHQIDIITQELEAVYPELVITNNSGYKIVDYTKLTLVLLEAIIEQQKDIESSTQENQLLRSELHELLEQMDELKVLVADMSNN